MKIVRSTLMRAAGPALMAGLLAASVATPAAAAAAPAPGSTAFRILGGLVGLQARAGVTNTVTATVSGTHLRLSDTTGIAIGPGCTRVDANTADCGPVATVTRLAVALGDGDDSFDGSTVDVNTIVDAGTGKDSVRTNGGNDLVDVEDNAGGDKVDCGGGTDTVFADPNDTSTDIVNCERRF